MTGAGWEHSWKKTDPDLLQPPHLIHPRLKVALATGHMFHQLKSHPSLSSPHPVDALRPLLCLFAQGSRYDPRRSL